jgi:hypothetical protein
VTQKDRSASDQPTPEHFARGLDGQPEKTKRVAFARMVVISLRRMAESWPGRLTIVGSALGAVLIFGDIVLDSEDGDLAPAAFLLGFGATNVLLSWWLDGDWPDRRAPYRLDDNLLKSDIGVAGGLATVILGLVALAYAMVS